MVKIIKTKEENMKKLISIIFLIAAINFAVAGETGKTGLTGKEQAQAAKSFQPVMSYQGIVKDAEGNAVKDGNYTLKFKIYNADTEGEVLWEEEQKLDLKNGIVNCYLGVNNGLNLPFDEQYWLSLEIGGEELPRTMMAGTPYAMMAKRLAKDAIVAGNGISVEKRDDGKVEISGKVGGKSNTRTAGHLNNSSGGGSGVYMTGCTTHTGAYSLAIGHGTTVSGDYSFGIGKNVNATGHYSYALGAYNNASGEKSTSIGYYANSQGKYAVSLGHGTQAKAQNSVAIGKSVWTRKRKSLAIGFNDSGTYDPMFYVDSSKVCIGLTENYINKADSGVFHVNGDMYATKIIVQNADDNWPDYVFEEGYRLTGLEETEKFIAENKHLPGVPSAKDVGKNGNDLGEMDKILLRKIEEMTLLMIEQNKLIKIQEKRIRNLEEKSGE